MRVQAVPTTKLQITVDVVTDRLIGEIAELGVHGVNKSEVASSIIRMWLWENWAAAGSVDTDLSFLSFLELYRTDVPESRMPARRVVEALDVVEDV